MNERAKITLELPEGYELAEPKSRQVKHGEWYLELINDQLLAKQWPKDWRPSILNFYILKPISPRAESATYAVTVEDIYGDRPLIPYGYIQGRFQTEHYSNAYAFLGTDGEIHKWPETPNGPRIWLEVGK